MQTVNNSVNELRDLDEKIHRLLFGFADTRILPVARDPESGSPVVVASDWVEIKMLDAKPDWCYLPEYDHGETGNDFCRVIPRYSEDVKAAFKVVEKLRSLNKFWKLELVCVTEHDHPAYRFRILLTCNRHGHLVPLVSNSASAVGLAVCLVADELIDMGINRANNPK